MQPNGMGRNQDRVLHQDQLPRICFMSYYKLIQYSQPVIHEYSNKAFIDSIDASFTQALIIAKDKIKNDAVDVFVSAGSNASILKENLHLPVISIEVSGYDILRSLMEAKTIGSKIGIISYKDVLPPLNQFSELLNVELYEYTYTHPDDALMCIKSLKDLGIDVVLGSSLIVDLATKLGVKSILSYSLDSIRNAFDQAIEVCRIKKLEENRFTQIHNILQTLPEAVVAVDVFDRITAINQKMHDIISPSNPHLIGKTLSDIQPELSLVPQLLNQTSQLTQAIQLSGKNWITASTTIIENQTVVGATLTLYAADSILKADEKLRIFERSKHTNAKYTFSDLKGKDENFLKTILKAKQYSSTDLDIMILGETGTGKEIFAQAIHNASNRAEHPFIAVNCAAFPESLIESELFGHDDGAFTGSKKGGRRGLIEAAHKGTLFLDEIGDMPLQLQTRLLRVLQQREVTRLGANVAIPIDIRVITATHQNLSLLIQNNTFRSDLYYRINELEIKLLPLRHRKQDIIDLFKQRVFSKIENGFDHKHAGDIVEKISPYLVKYNWPGNYRELQNIIQRILLIVSLNKSAYLEDVEQEMPHIFNLDGGENNIAPASNEDFSLQHAHGLHVQNSFAKKEHALRAMEIAEGKHRKAAHLLGISRTTLWRWLNEN